LSAKSAGALQQQVAATAHDVVVAAAAARQCYDTTGPRHDRGPGEREEERGEGRGERGERENERGKGPRRFRRTQVSRRAWRKPVRRGACGGADTTHTHAAGNPSQHRGAS